MAAKEGGLTRAVEKLCVSQPSICTQIQALEQALGEKLLRRTPRPLRVHIGTTDSLPKLLTRGMLKPIFHLPQAVQASCCEGKVPDLLAQLAT